VVEFGSPITIPPEYVELFQKGGKEKREAITKVLDIVFDGLKSVTVRAPDYETLMVRQQSQSQYGGAQMGETDARTYDFSLFKPLVDCTNRPTRTSPSVGSSSSTDVSWLAGSSTRTTRV
jgi:hypothetical protein